MSKGTTRRRAVAGMAATAAGISGLPAILGAEPESVKIGLLHPVTGAVAFAGAQCRYGCELAIRDLNEAGGVASLGGAKLEARPGDTRSSPETGAAEVARLKQDGAHALSGCGQSSVGLAATQAAARLGIPFSIDVGLSDRLVERGLRNVYRLAAGYRRILDDAVASLGAINDGAGRPARTAIIVHEESEFGTGTANLMKERLPAIGIEVLDILRHANPTRNFDGIAARIRALGPDIVMPIAYASEYVMLARTLKQQRVDFMASVSVFGGGFSQKFVEDMPDVAEYMIDVNHWYDAKSRAALDLRRRVEGDGRRFTFEVYLSYNSIRLLHDAFERAGSTAPDAVMDALAASTLDPLLVPYGPTRFVDGQNEGARAAAIQVQNKAIEVLYPPAFASAAPVFPRPRA